MAELREKHIGNWEEFQAELRQLRAGEAPAKPLLFRGQAKSDGWYLTTTLEREAGPATLFKDYYRLISNVRPQVESSTGNQWQIPGYCEIERLSAEYEPFQQSLTHRFPGYPYMVYLRHHGFPSPLLDWTRSPYIAAHFAFSKADEDQRTDVAIYALSEAPKRSLGKGNPSIVRLGPYVTTHPRHFLQQSEYTICVVFQDGWRFAPFQSMFSPENPDQDVLWKFTIPAGERLKVLEHLDEYNLNAYSLFGSEESLMETMALKELHFKKRKT